MLRYLTRCLLLSSLLLALSCGSVHKGMQPASGDVRAVRKFAPVFKNVLYRTQVDVVGGHHLSGVLLIKTLADKSIRMIFSNEMGVKFFDFEFPAAGGFKVHSIIKKMDKKPVITTLQKDFELVMMRSLTNTSAFIRQDGDYKYFIFPQQSGFYQYVTNNNVSRLIRMERASRSKVVVQAIMTGIDNGLPDSIGISHKNFKFEIALKRIPR